jgi:hypothetical protein
MAVSFYTPQFTGDTCYTSQLQELHVLTFASHINFYVYRQAQIYYSGNGRMLIFETDYYTHQSRATSGSFRRIYTKKHRSKGDF